MKEAIIVEPKQTHRSSIIWLHGLGASGDDFAPIAPILELAQTRFIFPHAPYRKVTLNHGMEMRAWYDIYSLDFGAQQDLNGIQAANQLITQLIDNEQSQGIAPENIILAGFSQGAAMALYTCCSHPHALGGTIALSGYLPVHDTLMHKATAASKNTPLFIAHGDYDPVVPIQFGKMSHTLLTQMGYSSTFHQYPIEHSVSDAEILAIKQWLKAMLD